MILLPTRLVIGLLVAIPVMAGVLVPRPMPVESEETNNTDPYAATINTAFFPKDGEAMLRTRTDEKDRIVELTTNDKEVLDFAAKSYLRRDIFADDPTIWTVENNVVTGIIANRYRDILPSAGRSYWAGRLLYAPRFIASTAGQRDDEWQAQLKPIMLESVTAKCPGLELTATSNGVITGEKASADMVDYRRNTATCNGGTTPVSVSRIQLYCRPGDAEPVARLVRVGNEVAIYRVESQASCPVTVGRTDIRFGPRVVVPVGALVRIGEGDDGYGFFRRGGDDRRMLSYFTRAGVRDVDKQSPLEPLAKAFDQDYMRALIAAGRAQRGAVIGDVETSFDPDLEENLQKLLVEAVRNEEGSVRPGDRPVLATATILNALTGEVVAMASIDRSKPRPDGGTRIDPNLVPLPIGSTAKAIFATAVVAARPDLADVCMSIKKTDASATDGDSISKTILNHKFPGKGLQTSARDNVDFGDFIETSNSGYLAGLLLLASPDNGGLSIPLEGAARYGQGGNCQNKTSRPKSIYENLETGSDRVTGTLRPPEWQKHLQALFQFNIDGHGVISDTTRIFDKCLSLPGDTSPEPAWGSRTVDAGPWRGLFAGHPNGPASACLFDASAPRREALGLTGFRAFYEDIVQAALGGGEGRLSTVKLAESYARIVTGRQIAASFTPVTANALPGPISPDIYPEAARKVVTAAMTRSVFGPAGTGRRAQPALMKVAGQLTSAGLTLGQFAKTGTSSILVVRFSPHDQEINRLIGQGCITGRSDSTGRITAVFAPSNGAAACPQNRYQTRIDQLNAMPDAFETAENGVLTGLSASPQLLQDSAQYAGKVFAMVVASYRRDEVGGQYATDGMGNPQSAYAIAINFRFRVPDPSSNPAALLAGKIVETLLVDRLRGTAMPSSQTGTP